MVLIATIVLTICIQLVITAKLSPAYREKLNSLREKHKYFDKRSSAFNASEDHIRDYHAKRHRIGKGLLFNTTDPTQIGKRGFVYYPDGGGEGDGGDGGGYPMPRDDGGGGGCCAPRCCGGCCMEYEQEEIPEFVHTHHLVHHHHHIGRSFDLIIYQLFVSSHSPLSLFDP